jgi:Starch-binding associating with outer membrane
MKKNNKIIAIMTGLALLLASSCTKNFEEINTNPNAPDQAPMSNVMAYVVYSLSTRFGVAEMEYPAAFVGHVTKGTYTDNTTLKGRPSASVWTGNYRTVATNANFVIKEAEEEGNANMQAAAMVLKAYAMQMITDVYGKCPYFEAGLGSEGLIQPAFDTQEEIYADLMLQLETANSMFNEDLAEGGVIVATDDVLYGGDVMKWKKFCNSLHLRMAIRISNVDEGTASAAISKILNDPDTYPVLESNDDNAALAYPGDEEWYDNWSSYHNSIGDDRMGKPLVDSMLSYADPRLAYYADTIEGGLYVGLTIGEETAGSKAESLLNPLFIDNPSASTYFMKYAEVELIRAEAAVRGFVSSSAREAYEAAITASCQEYGIADPDIAAYLSGPKVAWAGDVNQIYVQKWLSLFHQSWEAWAEVRRTDVPRMDPAANMDYTGHNRPPFRFPYPESEVTSNGANIPEDVVEDDLYWGSRVWWDVRTGVQ